MPTPTWTLSINGIVTAGTYTDVSAYMLSAAWSLGFSAPYEPIARESTLSVVLNNSDQRFSPEAGALMEPSCSRGWSSGSSPQTQPTAP